MNENDFGQNDDAESPRLQDIISWLERVTRRSLGDVRIHDSEQAGQLARRLGARAFTAGRHVYVRPELLRPLTHESAALLAHELYHVAEQSGEVAVSEQQVAMPLLRPSLAHTRAQTGYSESAYTMSASPSAAPAMPVQRVATTTSGGLSASETTAEAVAGAVAQQTRPSSGKRKQAAPSDPEVIADLVYAQIARELILDRERGAY